MRNQYRFGIVVVTVLVLLLALSGILGVVASTSVSPTASISLSAGTINRSAPVLADLDGDGKPEILIGTEEGRLVAFKYSPPNTLSEFWNISLTSYGVATASSIVGKPAVADLNNDGKMEVIVGYGDLVEQAEDGGVIVFTNVDTASPQKFNDNWPQQTRDWYGPGNGYALPANTDGIVGSPAVGDLDGDGDLEIVAASFDQRVYAWHHDGTAVNGFPYTLIHSVWSSPALGDLNRDGEMEIILNTDQGQYENASWNCPYPIWPGRVQDYCGGTTWAFDVTPTGVEVLPGFPIYTWEMMMSAVAVVDLDGDGWLDIVSGTGTFYSDYHNQINYSTSNSTSYANYVYAWDHNGLPLEGWPVRTEVAVQMPGSPVIGDINGDGQLNVVAPGRDGKIYAWKKDGSAVSGFPMTPLPGCCNTPTKFAIYNGIVLGNYDGTGGLEIFAPVGWEVAVARGNGTQITHSGLTYSTQWVLNNYPALGDLDNNGTLELVVAAPASGGTGGQIFVWSLSGSSVDSTWPQHRRNERGTALIASLSGTPDTVTVLHPYGSSTSPGAVTLYSGGISTTWSVMGSPPADVTISPNSGSLPGIRTIPLTVDGSGYMTGTYDLGTVTLQADAVGDLVGLNEYSFLVRLVVGDIRNVYLPIMVRNQ